MLFKQSKKGRLHVVAIDALFCAAIALLWSLALATPAYAYVDPSVMTYTIQALAGVAVAMSTVLGVVWRRARHWALKALSIDESAGKVAEPEVCAAPTQDADRSAFLAEADAAAADARRLQSKPAAPKLPWHSRFILALVASATLCFMTFVAAPLEIVATNASSLSFSPESVCPCLAMFAFASAIVMSALVSIAKGKPYFVLLALLVTISLSSLLQALFLNSSLPSTNGSSVDWDDYALQMMLSCVLWVLVIGGGIVISLKSPLSAGIGFLVVCAALIISQAVSLTVTLQAHASEFDRAQVTDEGLMSVSSKSNVIIFVLDMYDTQYLDMVLAEYPDALDEMTGFTWFRNSVGSAIPTRYAIPFLITGNTFDYDYETTSYEEICSWYSSHNLVDDANDQGYSVGIYTDNPGPATTTGDTSLEGRTINILNTTNVEVNPLSTIESLVGCALYRNLPWIAKPAFRYTTVGVNNDVLSDAATDEESAYTINDSEYYTRLLEEGLVADDAGENGAYRLIHLKGAHWPYSMDENCVEQEEGSTTLVQQSVGCLKIVSEYLSQLKELGVYEQSTIIITADHGQYYWSLEPYSAVSPLLLVKPAGESSGSCEISEVPTGHLDYPATIKEALGISVEEPTVFEVVDEDRKRYFNWNYEDTYNGKDTDILTIEYEIDGDVLDISNWHATGNKRYIEDSPLANGLLD